MKLDQFEKQQYLNVETFRKNGQGIKTPVWFVRDGEALQVWTQAGAGKAKRIRNNGTVRVAPSTGSGEPTGEWQDARAQTNESPEAIKHVETLMKKKYGAMFYIFGFIGRMRGGAKYTAIKIQA
ncbi:MAG: PPOX class F420-dependent oxidoreductase [Anaerolineales bacterium]|nr:PPOX class F420-dependent oxidoreductase [Anaerolineales bacterium]